jgi:hypothetical protein
MPRPVLRSHTASWPTSPITATTPRR